MMNVKIFSILTFLLFSLSAFSQAYQQPVGATTSVLMIADNDPQYTIRCNLLSFQSYSASQLQSGDQYWVEYSLSTPKQTIRFEIDAISIISGDYIELDLTLLDGASIITFPTTNAVITRPTANFKLGLIEANSSVQTKAGMLNHNFIRIDSLLAQITAGSSSTYVDAGTNTTVTGNGEIATPYVVSVPSLDDADADPSNELQNWSNLPGIPTNIDTDSTDDFSGSFFDLENVPPDFQDLTDNVFDGDSSATNELQNWGNLPGIPANIDTDATDDFSGAGGDLTGVPEGFADGTDDGDNWGSQTAYTDETIKGNGTLVAPLGVVSGPTMDTLNTRLGDTSGQVIVYDTILVDSFGIIDTILISDTTTSNLIYEGVNGIDITGNKIGLHGKLIRPTTALFSDDGSAGLYLINLRKWWNTGQEMYFHADQLNWIVGKERVYINDGTLNGFAINLYDGSFGLDALFRMPWGSRWETSRFDLDADTIRLFKPIPFVARLDTVLAINPLDSTLVKTVIPENFSGAWGNLTGVPAGFADNTDNVEDADSDPTNELQNWSNLPGIPTNIDTDATDDFSGSWNDLTDIPPGFADGVDNTADGSGDGYAQGGLLNIANERIDIDMADPAGDFPIDLSSIENLPSFIGWDKDATDDFSGSWNDLSGIPAGFADNTDNVEDADADPTNELQNWSNLPGIPANIDTDATDDFSGAWDDLTGVPAGFSDNVDNVDDADADPTNELQNWSNLPGVPANIDTDATDDFSGAWSDLTGTPAGFSDNIDNVEDADADPANELQNWSNLPGIPANIDTDATDDFSGAWSDLTGIPAGFADNTDNVEDADADPTNELQNWSNLPGIPANIDEDATDDFSGSWSDLTSIPVGFADNTDNVEDADADPTNELQNWSNLPGIPANIDIDVTDDFDGSSLNNIGNVNISVLGNNDFIVWKSASGEWQNRNAASIGLSTIGHTHAASDITSGTFVDARISQSSVTQHEGALTITESQISDLSHFSGSWNDLTSVPAGFSDGTDDNTNIANANLSSNTNRMVDFNNNSLTFTETNFNVSNGANFIVDQTTIDLIADGTSTDAIDLYSFGGIEMVGNNLITIDAPDIILKGDNYGSATEGYIPTLKANKVIRWTSPADALGDAGFSGSWNDLTDIPAGFADGTDDEGSGGGSTPFFTQISLSSSQTLDCQSNSRGIFSIDKNGLTSSTITLSNPVVGGKYIMHFYNNSSNLCADLPSNFYNMAASQMAGTVSIGTSGAWIEFYYDGTNFRCNQNLATCAGP